MARVGASRLAHEARYNVRGTADAHQSFTGACSGSFIILKRQTVKEPEHDTEMLLHLGQESDLHVRVRPENRVNEPEHAYERSKNGIFHCMKRVRVDPNIFSKSRK